MKFKLHVLGHRQTLNQPSLCCVMSSTIISILTIFFFFLWFSYFRGVKPQGMYWSPSPSHMMFIYYCLNLYVYFTCPIILILGFHYWEPVLYLSASYHILSHFLDTIPPTNWLESTQQLHTIVEITLDCLVHIDVWIFWYICVGEKLVYKKPNKNLVSL